MIYTMGHKEFYDKGLQEEKELGNPFKKLGRTIDHQYSDGHRGYYRGGSVWKTEEEARKYLESKSSLLTNYDVYGVLADWEKDTEESKEHPWRDLLRTSQIVDIDP